MEGNTQVAVMFGFKEFEGAFHWEVVNSEVADDQPPSLKSKLLSIKHLKRKV